MATVKNIIPRAKTPESAGISSAEIMEFVKDAEECNYEFHSLMVIRHGKVAAEWYNKPYDADFKHMMYSVSKSFTSTAIGFALIFADLIKNKFAIRNVVPKIIEPSQRGKFID